LLLRVGVIMMTLSVLLVVAVALVVSLRVPAPAAESSQAKPLATQAAKAQQEDEPDLGEKLEIDDQAQQEDEPDFGKKLEIDDEPRQGKSEPRSKPAPREENPAPQRRGSDLFPLSTTNWTYPTSEELSQVGEPRYFDPDPGAMMTLTIEALGLYGVPVIDSNTEEALSRGVIHVPDTAYPWDNTDQKNVFLAGHRTGVPGTDGRLLFFDLDELDSGDEIILEDRSGNVYRYRVTELSRVGPFDAWVADTLVGRDLLTLQTCTYPTFEDRLIVRADRA
jgi:sortase A